MARGSPTLTLRVFMVIAALAGLAASDEPARADSQVESVGKATGYVVPAAGAAVTSLVNGVFIAYGEGSPRAWRIAGYAAGGIELAVGIGLLVAGTETTSDVALATVPLVLGVAAVGTAFFAPAPTDLVRGTIQVAGRQVEVQAVPTVGGVGLVGRF